MGNFLESKAQGKDNPVISSEDIGGGKTGHCISDRGVFGDSNTKDDYFVEHPNGDFTNYYGKIVHREP